MKTYRADVHGEIVKRISDGEVNFKYSAIQ